MNPPGLISILGLCVRRILHVRTSLRAPPGLISILGLCVRRILHVRTSLRAPCNVPWWWSHGAQGCIN